MGKISEKDAYILRVGAVERVIRDFMVRTGKTPAFALPLIELHVIAPIDVFKRLPRNDAGREVLESLYLLEPAITVFMLGCALDALGIPVEHVPLRELGADECRILLLRSLAESELH